MTGEIATAAAKRSPMKFILTISVILVVEAVIIVGAMTMLGGPAEVSAMDVGDSTEAAADQKIVEIQVLSEKLPNSKSGITYIYPTEIFVQVKTMHEAKVTAELEQFQNEIKAEITSIWRTSEPHHFQEPKLENLTRKVTALLSERFGNDSENNEPIVRKSVIVMSTGFPITG